MGEQRSVVSDKNDAVQLRFEDVFIVLGVIRAEMVEESESKEVSGGRAGQRKREREEEKRGRMCACVCVRESKRKKKERERGGGERERERKG